MDRQFEQVGPFTYESSDVILRLEQLNDSGTAKVRIVKGILTHEDGTKSQIQVRIIAQQSSQKQELVDLAQELVNKFGD